MNWFWILNWYNRINKKAGKMDIYPVITKSKRIPIIKDWKKTAILSESGTESMCLNSLRNNKNLKEEKKSNPKK